MLDAQKLQTAVLADCSILTHVTWAECEHSLWLDNHSIATHN